MIVTTKPQITKKKTKETITKMKVMDPQTEKQTGKKMLGTMTRHVRSPTLNQTRQVTIQTETRMLATTQTITMRRLIIIKTVVMMSKLVDLIRQTLIPST